MYKHIELLSIFRIFATVSLFSIVSAGRIGYFQPASGYSVSGANVYSSASASAYTNSYGGHIPIQRYENANNGDGTYRYDYETGNGIAAYESGAPRANGPEGPAVTSDGGFSYTAPNGQKVSLSYRADEDGFHPVGSHIPTPPPIPVAILRSIEFNRNNPSTGDGSYYGGRYHHGY